MYTVAHIPEIDIPLRRQYSQELEMLEDDDELDFEVLQSRTAVDTAPPQGTSEARRGNWCW